MKKIKKPRKTEDRLAEAERILAEMQKDRKKAEAKAEAQAAKWRAESEARWAKIDAAIAATNEQLGGFTQGAGDALEQEYADTIKRDKRIGGIVIHRVYANVGEEYEFDWACPNGKVVVVGEVKTRFTKSDVRKFAKDRLTRFAENCPELARGRKVIGAIGGGSIPKAVREEAEKCGLLVLGLEDRKLIVKSDKGARAV